MEDYSYGADELFYQDAVNGGITVYIEDGVTDGDELVDMYVIPTWGVAVPSFILAGLARFQLFIANGYRMPESICLVVNIRW